MLAAVVLGGIVPMAGYIVVQHRRDQVRAEACEGKIEALVERYHDLAEQIAAALPGTRT